MPTSSEPPSRDFANRQGAPADQPALTDRAARLPTVQRPRTFSARFEPSPHAGKPSPRFAVFSIDGSVKERFGDLTITPLHFAACPAMGGRTHPGALLVHGLGLPDPVDPFADNAHALRA